MAEKIGVWIEEIKTEDLTAEILIE